MTNDQQDVSGKAGERAWSDPLTWGAGVPVHDRLAEMRARCPVAHVGRGDADDGFWLVTGYDEVESAGRDRHHRFSAAVPGLGAVVVAPDSGPGATGDVVAPLFEQDGADHRRVRQVMAPHLTRLAADRRAPSVRALVDNVLGELRPAGRADLVTDVAWRVSPLVTADLLGIPVSARSEFVRLLRASVVPDGCDDASPRYLGFLREQVRVRRGGPSGDLLSEVVNAETSASEDQLVKFAALMVAATTLTAVDAIGNVLLLLCEVPTLREQVIQDPELIPLLVEESVRWESPVALTSRVAVAPVRVGDVELTAGDRVLLAWGSASRDESVIADGDTPRLDRATTRHLGWGCGPHECPGRHLARVQLTAIVKATLILLPDYRVVGPTPARSYGALRGPASLPVTWSVQSS